EVRVVSLGERGRPVVAAGCVQEQVVVPRELRLAVQAVGLARRRKRRDEGRHRGVPDVERAGNYKVWRTVVVIAVGVVAAVAAEIERHSELARRLLLRGQQEVAVSLANEEILLEERAAGVIDTDVAIGVFLLAPVAVPVGSGSGHTGQPAVEL